MPPAQSLHRAAAATEAARVIVYIGAEQGQHVGAAVGEEDLGAVRGKGEAQQACPAA